MVLRRGEVLDYLAELTRRGHAEWYVMQSLDPIRILLALGCSRTNERMNYSEQKGPMQDGSGGGW